MDINDIRNEIKNKKRISKYKKKNNFNKFLNRILITVIITLVTLITLKSNEKLRTKFYDKIYNNSFNFATINKLFKDKFGSPIPFSDVIKKSETKPVFNEKLEYKEKSKYLDGVKLTVAKNYLVPTLENGIVVYIGEKENYGNTVIIEQVDGVDVWYSNINTSNIKLYDYLDKGSFIGEVKDNNLYMVFKSEGNVLNYEKYI